MVVSIITQEQEIMGISACWKSSRCGCEPNASGQDTKWGTYRRTFGSSHVGGSSKERGPESGARRNKGEPVQYKRVDHENTIRAKQMYIIVEKEQASESPWALRCMTDDIP